MTHARIGKKFARFSLDLDLAVPAGVTALFGPPGAGKSLLLEALAGFVKPDSGRILLDDAILFDADTRVNLPPARRRCGYVAQRDSLFPHMTLRQNLIFAAPPLPRLERHRRVGETLERFQLTAVADSRPRDVAASERLRGAVARALLAAPKLLLIDERGIDEALLRRVREHCAGPVIVVTADLDLCCAAADQLVLLEAGRIVQRGAPGSVVGAPESLDAARLLGIPNLFQATVLALDPGRNTSRLEFEHFTLAGPYIKGRLRGDRVWVAVHPGDVRVHSGQLSSQPNCVGARPVRTVAHSRSLRMEFENGIYADVPHAEYARQRDNQSWAVEFPPEALRIL